MELLWTDIKKVSTGMVDEKVTVISSVVHIYIVHTKAKLEVEMGSVLIFLLLKLGTP